MDKHTIIQLKLRGHSNRDIERITGHNRKTVARYWKQYERQRAELEHGGDVELAQEAIITAPKYDTSHRGPAKYNAAIDALIEEILAEEAAKDHRLGPHKQRLTNRQIHERVRDAGHDIGLTVVSQHVRAKRAHKTRETFIRQTYDYGQRLEYDFGEVKLIIGGKKVKRYMAVLSSPASGFRWSYLYSNQKKEAFLDSHVRFFEMVGGVYGEVVYDNMRNVVTRFIGKNEKELNEDLVKMSLYYGFTVNVTNCFRGNEKGHVEGSVKYLRNRIFATDYRFDSMEEAEHTMHQQLEKINRETWIEEEKQCLLPYTPPLEIAIIQEQRVDRYSFIRCENNFYSVPEYLTGRLVRVKNYPTKIVVYAEGHEVCRHEKKEGDRQMSVELFHYLETFRRKPGALKNSVALKSNEALKAIFDLHFIGKEREFIAVLQEHPNKNVEELVALLEEAVALHGTVQESHMQAHIVAQARSQLQVLTSLFAAREGV